MERFATSRCRASLKFGTQANSPWKALAQNFTITELSRLPSLAHARKIRKARRYNDTADGRLFFRCSKNFQIRSTVSHLKTEKGARFQRREIEPPFSILGYQPNIDEYHTLKRPKKFFGRFARVVHIHLERPSQGDFCAIPYFMRSVIFQDRAHLKFGALNRANYYFKWRAGLPAAP